MPMYYVSQWIAQAVSELDSPPAQSLNVAVITGIHHTMLIIPMVQKLRAKKVQQLS